MPGSRSFDGGKGCYRQLSCGTIGTICLCVRIELSVFLETQLITGRDGLATRWRFGVGRVFLIQPKPVPHRAKYAGARVRP